VKLYITLHTEGDWPVKGPAYRVEVVKTPEDFDSLECMRAMAYIAKMAVEKAKIEKIVPHPNQPGL